MAYNGIEFLGINGELGSNMDYQRSEEWMIKDFYQKKKKIDIRWRCRWDPDFLRMWFTRVMVRSLLSKKKKRE